MRHALQEALDRLTQPSLIPTFPDDVLYTLCRHATSADDTIPMAYYHSVSPPLASNKVRDAYFEVLSRVSITEAFYFSRARGDAEHEVLFEKLIAFAITQSSRSCRADRGLELISLPMTDAEEASCERILRASDNGKAHGELSGSIDTLIMRNIAIGHPVSALGTLPTTSRGQVKGINWERLVNDTR